MYNLNDKVAVVTGSGRGIGREIAIALATHGSKVVVNVKKRIEDGNETLKLIKDESSGIMVQADVSSREGCRKLLNETVAKYGKCDILVNNAGISIAMPFLESDDRLIEKTISTNLMANIYCSQEFGKIMNENGVIINISSIAGIKPMSFLSIYGITKSAIIGLTEYLAVELSPRGIRVNAVAPAVVKTKMGDSLFELLNISEEEYVRNYTLTNKIIKPEEIAHAVIFLIESENITGQTIVIDSGQTLMNIFSKMKQ
ncbi:MAG: SDR family oxidoreductase [Thermoplasmata archaeon]